MPRKAEIVIRLLATLCGLYGLILVGGGLMVATLAFRTAGGSGGMTPPMVVVILMLAGLGALILHVCWGVWRRLLPLTVRHFGFVIGLILWHSLADSALFAEPLAASSGELNSFWRFFGPMGVATLAGTLVSHVFRRLLFPVTTPPSWIERRLRSPSQGPG